MSSVEVESTQSKSLSGTEPVGSNGAEKTAKFGSVSETATEKAVALQSAADNVDRPVVRECFIPVSRFALSSRLTREEAWRSGESEHAKRFFRFLGAWRNLVYTERLLNLKEAYLPFSPDRDTVRATKFDADALSQHLEHLTNSLTELLQQANYRKVPPEQLDEIFAEDSAYGLDLEVDLAEFEELILFSRGARINTVQQRTWKKLYFGFETIDIPTFQRLFLLIKLKSEEVRIRELMQADDIEEPKARKRLKKLRRMMPDHVTSEFVYLKLFKNIPRADLQMLFPNTRVQFRPLDKIKLGVTAGGGTVASIVSSVSKLALFAINPIKAGLALLGLAGVIVRQIMKFFNQRNQYMMVLAQNLYFHNLADNRGVLTLLADRAEEEDVKEEMLLYSLLSKEPLLAEELAEAKDAIEQFLADEFGVHVEYDIDDALARLTESGIVTHGDDGLLVAMSPQEGCEHIDRMWDDYLNTADFFREPASLTATS